MPRLPRLAIVLGLLGLIPFAALGIGAVLPDPGGHRLPLLIGYGAVILSFLGGVHEGFAILAPAPLPSATRPAGDWAEAERFRLVGASACAALGWFALVIAAVLPAWIALATLIAGFTGLTLVEQRAVRHGWMPTQYMWLRWGLSTAVVLILAAVIVLRIGKAA